MTQYEDVDGSLIETPSADDIKEIISTAQHQMRCDFCDHPSDFLWAERILKMALFIESGEGQK